MKSSLISLRQACAWTFAALLIFAGAGVNHLYGQAATATVQGTVTDMSGAAVPAASVVLKNTGTGASRTVNSDEAGRYRVSDLQVGSYDVTASKAGFSTVAHNGITLNVGAEVNVDLSMPVGQQTQTVTVEGQVTQVETTSAAVSTLTDQHQMKDLPLNGRNFEQLILLAPGVNSVTTFTGSGFQGRANEYSVAGSRPAGQALLLDDESLQNFWNKGMGSVTGTSLGVEAIGEFQTLTNLPGAQYGGNGSVINSVSKSGTNSYHGSVYEFFRNDVFDAYDTFAKHTVNPIKPVLRQNQYGGSLGGPIKKDKLFFFGNFEGVQKAQGVVKSVPVPNCTAANAFTGGACTPTTTDPVAAADIINVLKLFPRPDNGVGGISTQIANQVASESYGLGRIDYNMSDKDSFFFRSATDAVTYTDPFGGGGFGGGGGGVPLWPEGDTSLYQFTTVEWRRIISPTMVNVVRAHYTRTATIGSTTNSTPALQVFFPGAGRQDGQVTFGGSLAGLGGATQLPFNEVQNRFTEGDDVTWTKGAQTIRMGASISRLQTNTYMPFRQGSTWAFAGLSGFLSGSPTTLSWTPLTIPAGLPGAGAAYANRDLRDIELTPYFQDDWKVSSKLTVNFGVRWEFITNPVDTHNDLFAITNLATSTNFTNVPNTFKSNLTYKNFDPRIGFAFDPFNDHKTSIRGGIGIYHDLILPSNYILAYWDQPPWTTFQVGQSVPGTTPALFPTIPTSGKPAVTSSPGFDWNNNVTPYVIQYNLSVQRELTQGTLLSVAFVGSRGLHLLTQVEQNPLVIGASGTTVNTLNGNNGFNAAGTSVVTYGRVNTNLGSFPDFIPTTNSRYESLQVAVNRRLSHNVQAQVSYTWGKCTDDGSFVGSFNSNANAAWGNPYNQSYDNAVCNYDITQSLRVNGLWNLPFYKNRAVSGWQLSGIVSSTTGLPFTVFQGIDTLGFGTSVDNPRPNYIGGNAVTGNTGGIYFNPSDFALAPLGTFGNSGRLSLRGPGFNNTDIAVIKDTKIRENMNLQFRAEFFNLFNHTNYGVPIMGNGTANLYTAFVGGNPVANPNAGKILYDVGNPRQIQFALKLTF